MNFKLLKAYEFHMQEKRQSLKTHHSVFSLLAIFPSNKQPTSKEKQYV